MLHYDMPLYRPPSEGNNLIIQATLGCSFNQCSFCSMYKEKVYQARELAAVKYDIDIAARHWPDARRVFLADGDALVLPTDDLLEIIDHLRLQLPRLQRASCYATPINILKKSPEELQQLAARGLSLLYLGIESGDNGILKRITKGASQRGLAEAMHKAVDNGLKLSSTVILGLGGQAHWESHIDGTLELLNQAPTHYLSTLQLFLDPQVRDEFARKFGEPFRFQDDQAILLEQQRLIAGLSPPRPVIFRSNHASNALALAGNLPRDREPLLEQVRLCLEQQRGLRPRYMRRL